MKLFGKLSFSAAVLTFAVAMPAHAWDAERGEELSQPCAACHGEDGNSASGNFPTSAGQYRDYLFQSMLAYQRGERTDPVMAPQVEDLSQQDLRDLAAFYAKQDGLYLKR